MLLIINYLDDKKPYVSEIDLSKRNDFYIRRLVYCSIHEYGNSYHTKERKISNNFLGVQFLTINFKLSSGQKFTCIIYTFCT